MPVIPVNAKPGDIGLASFNSAAGRTIRVLQWMNGSGFGKYEHAFVYIGNGQCIQANPDGAAIGKADSDGMEFWSTGILNPTDEQRDGIVAAAHGYIGTPYSYLDYAALAAKRLNIPAPHLVKYIKSTNQMMCSQLVSRCWYDAGCPLFGSEWTGYNTPGDIYELLLSKIK